MASVTPLPFKWNVAAGALAGGTELMCMYPLDLLKTRQQLNTSGPSKRMISSLVNIVRTEGPFALYRGILPPMLVEPVKRAVKFSANARYKKFIIGDDEPTVAKFTLCGAMAGSTEAIVIAPFEVIKIRLQSKARKGVYKNTFDCFKKMLSIDGPMAFAQGLEPALLRSATWNGTYFGAIFVLKKHLPQPDEGSHAQLLMRNFAAGVVGGTLGTTFNTPFDTVASRMRNVLPGEATKYRGAWPALATIAREEGWKALWKGFGPKVARLGPGGGILLVGFEHYSNFFRRHYVEP